MFSHFFVCSMNESLKLFRATMNPGRDDVQTLGSVVVGVKFYPHKANHKRSGTLTPVIT